jgi:hypothetical protein
MVALRTIPSVHATIQPFFLCVPHLPQTPAYRTHVQVSKVPKPIPLVVLEGILSGLQR